MREDAPPPPALLLTLLPTLPLTLTLLLGPRSRRRPLLLALQLRARSARREARSERPRALDRLPRRRGARRRPPLVLGLAGARGVRARRRVLGAQLGLELGEDVGVGGGLARGLLGGGGLLDVGDALEEGVEVVFRGGLGSLGGHCCGGGWLVVGAWFVECMGDGER